MYGTDPVLNQVTKLVEEERSAVSLVSLNHTGSILYNSELPEPRPFKMTKVQEGI